MTMTTLRYGLAAGRSLVTSTPTILGPNPSRTVFSSKKPVSPSIPGTPLEYTEIREPSIEGPSSMRMTPSVMYGPATRQSPVTPLPSIDRREPSYYAAIDSNGVTVYRCECGHETHRKCDMLRHHETLKHVRRGSYNCTFPDCTKTFTRKYGLKRHLQKHSIDADKPVKASRGTGTAVDP